MPRRLCVAADKRDEGTIDPSAALMCYDVTQAMIGHDSSRTISALLAVAANTRSDAVAVSDEQHALTYAELALAVARSAARLADAGIGVGDHVGIVLPNSCGFVDAFLATVACGAVAVPLSAAAPPAELARQLDQAGAVAVITTRGAAVSNDGRAHLSDADGELRIERARPAHRAPSEPRDTDAAIALTSFSTTPPSLVVRTHENLWWDAEHAVSAMRLDASDNVLGLVPLSHAHGLGNALLASLRARARLVVRARFERGPTLDLLEHERVTVFPTIPFMVRMLETADRRRTWDLAALRWCVSAAAPLRADTYRTFFQRFGVPVRQLYGLSAAGDVTLNVADVAVLDPESVGTPLGDVEVRIVGEDRRLCRDGVAGEIVVRSRAASGGKEHELRTGDLGRRTRRGEIVLTGRRTRFLNVAGNKVDPSEVAATLRSHPAVVDVTVGGEPGAHGDQVVSASVVTRVPCTAEALRLHCRGLIASYKIPHALHVEVRPRN